MIKLSLLKLAHTWCGDTAQCDRSYRIPLIFVVQKARYSRGLWETLLARVVALLTCGNLVDREVGLFMLAISILFTRYQLFSGSSVYLCFLKAGL